MLNKTIDRNWTQWAMCLFVFAGAFALAGCNTLEGAGEDVEDAGEAVQDAAD